VSSTVSAAPDDPVLTGSIVSLRPVTAQDVPALAAVREKPEVRARWNGPDDVRAEILESIADAELHYLAIVLDGRIVGAIQWQGEEEPDYRHASIDIYVDPAAHGRGVGTDAVRTLATHLVDAHRYHRLTIDPAADNAPAIRCYAKVGFKPVGVMRQYERGPDGTWHDGLLMDLLASELVR
jgi:aminoglycoside 6'-N-acetyltransferase